MPTSFWTLIRDKNDRSILGTAELQFEVMIYVFFSNYCKEGLHYVIPYKKLSYFWKYLRHKRQLFNVLESL